MKRNATAVWNGKVKEGKGTLTTQSTVLEQTPYSFNSRFEEGKGTNPEELIAAAHAGCFTMQLSAFLGEAGYDPEQLETKCTIEINDGTITSSHLELTAKIDGIQDDEFQQLVTKAEKNCPVSKLLTAQISSAATLNA